MIAPFLLYIVLIVYSGICKYPRPVLDQKKPQKTDMDQFSLVWSSLFQIFDFEGLVSVPVLPKKGKRPDQTRLSNTTDVVQH